uniref:Uncharacterized protein n=1 Tax=Arundo donax TaxID=35708 RepID=A0A0A8YNS8_ARUDO
MTGTEDSGGSHIESYRSAHT